MPPSGKNTPAKLTSFPWTYFLRELLIVLAVVALAFFSALQSRLRYEQQAKVSADNLAQLLARQVGGAVEKIDLVLRAVVRDVQQYSPAQADDTYGLELLLAQQHQLLPDAKDLLIADGEGVFRYGSAVPPGFRIEVPDRDFFRRLRDVPGAGLVIGGPFRHPVDGQWSLAFARRVSRTDGSFAGIVAASISAEHFQEMLYSLNLGARGAVALRTVEMATVARIPALPGQDAAGSQALSPQMREALVANPEQGTYVARSPFDGVERTVAYRRLAGLSLYIVVGLATEDVLAPWWDDVAQLGALSLVFILIALWLSRLARRAALREEVERVLAEEREASRRRLEQEVAQRTADLQAANRQLEGFLYALSHDLRGPLGRISSFSTLLERNYRDRLEGDGLVFLGFIRDNALRLNRLVDDLLSHARVDRQATCLEPVDLPAALAAVLEEQAGEIRDAGAVVEVDLPAVRVLADRYGLHQVLRNLLENAIKYSSGEENPRVGISGLVVDGRFRLGVRDNGIGFAMEYHDRIFKMFRRLHTHAEYAGSGVGLALVKRAMERMGGKVWAESEPGRGAIFYLEFELAGEPEEAGGPASSSSRLEGR